MRRRKKVKRTWVQFSEMFVDFQENHVGENKDDSILSTYNLAATG
jgi:hypothetical protein